MGLQGEAATCFAWQRKRKSELCEEMQRRRIAYTCAAVRRNRSGKDVRYNAWQGKSKEGQCEAEAWYRSDVPGKARERQREAWQGRGMASIGKEWPGQSSAGQRKGRVLR